MGSCKGCCFLSVKRLLIVFYEELMVRDVKVIVEYWVGVNLLLLFL